MVKFIYFQVLILFFCLYGCANSPSVGREPQSQNVFNVTKIENHSQRNLKIIAKSTDPIQLKYRLLKPINAGAAFTDAQIEVKGGNVSQSKIKSDDKGFISFNFFAGSTAGTAEVMVKAGKVQIVTNIEILPAIEYSKVISPLHSSIELTKNSVLADAQDQIQLKFNLKDHDQKPIEYNSHMETEWRVKFGTIKNGSSNSASYLAPRNSGVDLIEVSVEGVKLKSQEIQLLQTINTENVKIIENTQNSARVHFKLQLFDIFNKIIPNPNGLVTDMQVSHGTVRFSIENNYILAEIQFPNDRGESELTIVTSRGEIQKKYRFAYDNILPDLNQSKLSFSSKTMIANDFDAFEILLRLKNTDGTQIDTIAINEIKLESLHRDHKVLHSNQLKDGQYHFIISAPDNTDHYSELHFVYNDQAITEKFRVPHSTVIMKDHISLNHTFGEMGFHNNISADIFTSPSVFNTDTAVKKIVGFTLVNEGINAIVPRGGSADADLTSPMQSNREYSFHFDEHVRQNINFETWEDTTGFTSRFMVSHFVLAPRKFIPNVKINEQGNYEVTLTTGEKVVFDKDSKMIMSGVFKEGPIDMGPSRHTRTYADVRYQGSGVVIRANARGGSPQLGQFSQKVIQGDYGNIGDVDVMVYYYDHAQAKTKKCMLKKKDFWPPKDQSPIPFNFATDAELAKFLKVKCGDEYARRALGN